MTDRSLANAARIVLFLAVLLIATTGAGVLVWLALHRITSDAAWWATFIGFFAGLMIAGVFSEGLE